MKVSLSKTTKTDTIHLFVLLVGALFVYSLLETFLESVGWIVSVLIAIILSLVSYPIIEQRNYDQQQNILYDDLTCLPNRTLFNNCVIKNLQNNKSSFAVLIIDVDKFEDINNSMGHASGDILLQKVANCIQQTIRIEDLTFRIGEDSFGVMINNLPSGPEHLAIIEIIATKIIKNVHIPFEHNQHCIYMSVSVGISIHVEGKNSNSNFDELINQATTAMHQAKDKGRNGYCVYEYPDHIPTISKMEIQNALYKAVENNEFVVNYQPQIDVNTNKLVGAEALVRWNHPMWGMVSPSIFIPISEDTNLITNIGEIVLNIACNDCKRWQDAGHDIKIAVNLSVRQFQSEQIIHQITTALTNSGLSSSSLELEITESLIMNNMEQVLYVLKYLKTLGIIVAMDDFGTGYSSLSYLKKLPIDIVKIDQMFIRDMTLDDNAQMVLAIIQMAKALNMTTIAEGVETEEQFNFLRKKGCNIVQGCYVNNPLSSDDFFEKYIK